MKKYSKAIAGFIGVLAGYAATFLPGVDGPMLEAVVLAVLTVAGVYAAPANA